MLTARTIFLRPVCANAVSPSPMTAPFILSLTHTINNTARLHDYVVHEPRSYLVWLQFADTR